jgi:hypothetical protein
LGWKDGELEVGGGDGSGVDAAVTVVVVVVVAVLAGAGCWVLRVKFTCLGLTVIETGNTL